VVAVVAVPVSSANFNSRSKTVATASAAATSDYLRLWSQGTDPAGLTGYAVKTNSSPAVPAATGSDMSLKVAAGGHKNDPGSTLNRVLTVQARNPLPAGVSSITLSGSLIADPGGRQPLSGYSFSPNAGTPTSSTITLTAGQKAQLNLSLRLKNTIFPGNNFLYNPLVLITVTFAGYSGTFLSYRVPVSVWDGNGAGP
jgi:hypothetical protein